jgi:hypothetical protein
LQLEPFDLLDAWFRVASWRQGLGNVRSPANDLLVLVIVEHSGNLQTRDTSATFFLPDSKIIIV